jgi:beta-galactosidase
MPASEVFADSQAAQGRLILPMNRNWRYHPTKVDGAEAIGFDDLSFERVVVPHTNIELPWHNVDGKDYEFVSTYRQCFRLPSEAADKRVFVDFEGVMTASTVWINSLRNKPQLLPTRQTGSIH